MAQTSLWLEGPNVHILAGKDVNLVKILLCGVVSLGSVVTWF